MDTEIIKQCSSVPKKEDSTMRKIGIFGGSFNPIHVGHVSLARQLLREAGLDEVWFVVSPHNPLKPQGDLLDEQKRLELVRLALEGEPGLVASDCEFSLPRPSFTWRTLQHLSTSHPDCTFTLLIGGDNLRCFHRWAHAEELLSSYDIVVYPRGEERIDPSTLPPRVRLVDTPLLPVSSTEVRRRIASGEPFAQLVPEKVTERIESEGLYKRK